MADFLNTMKDIMTCSVRFVSRTATKVADATTYKLGELDNTSRRREAISELGEKIYSMFAAGVEMPEEAMPLLTELRELEEGMETMRTERAEKKEAAAKVLEEERAAREAAREAAAAERERLAAERAEARARAEAERAAAAAAAAAAATEPVATETPADSDVPADIVAEVTLPKYTAEETEVETEEPREL